AFTAAIAHADALLAKTPELYDALDAKGIAWCGLGILAETFHEMSPKLNIDHAITAFCTARKINSDAGVVARVVRLLDALAWAAPEGAALLAEPRRAAAGKQK
ncbi:MAG: hypothetical protein ONB13_13545, partial [candidate division KSB1 bacterium]|nr:hypothetical protein [candidate division KSB1 bacterium]